jgi:guanylate kinase
MIMNEKVLCNQKQGKVFVVSAPAGTGKTTLVQMLVGEFPCVVENISFTTRKSRPGELSGVHYHFISREEFEKKIAHKEMLEYVTLYGDYYGTSCEAVEQWQNQGKHVILVIDTQGALQLMDRFSAVFIFIKPPSLEELRERLIKRKTESPEIIERRLAWAQKEISFADKYDYCIINDNLDVAYTVLKSILIAEEHRNLKRS